MNPTFVLVVKVIAGALAGSTLLFVGLYGYEEWLYRRRKRTLERNTGYPVDYGDGITRFEGRR